MLTHEGARRITGAETASLRLLRGDAPARHYPPAARAGAIDGTVIVDLLVNAAGQVQEAEVLSESPAGHGFGLAALDAVKTYEFDNPFKGPVLMALTIQFEP